jgi:hypothetical protein
MARRYRQIGVGSGVIGRLARWFGVTEGGGIDQGNLAERA